MSSIADPSKEQNNLSDGDSEEELEQNVYMVRYESHEKDTDNNSTDEEYNSDDGISSEDEYEEDSDAYDTPVEEDDKNEEDKQREESEYEGFKEEKENYLMDLDMEEVRWKLSMLSTIETIVTIEEFSEIVNNA